MDHPICDYLSNSKFAGDINLFTSSLEETSIG